VGSRDGLDAGVKKNIPNPYRNSNPVIAQPAAQRYIDELSQLPAYKVAKEKHSQ
jgi:hypothetical protein